MLTGEQLDAIERMIPCMSDVEQRALVAALRAAWRERDEINEARLCCYDIHRGLFREVERHIANGHDQGGTLTNAVVEYAAGEAWASEVDSLRAERDRYRAALKVAAAALDRVLVYHAGGIDVSSSFWYEWVQQEYEAAVAALAAPDAGGRATEEQT